MHWNKFGINHLGICFVLQLQYNIVQKKAYLQVNSIDIYIYIHIYMYTYNII